MSDNVSITPGSGNTIAADEVIDGTLGTVKVGYVKLMDGALDGTQKIGGDASNGLDVDVTRVGGNVTVIQPTGSNLHTVVDSGTITTVSAVTAISNALPAGTNAIGKLAANTGVDIGDVDVTSVVPGTSATSLGKAEDAAHASGDTGVMLLTVRKDTAVATSGTDGDYQPAITDANGRMHVVATAAITSTQLDDATFTPGSSYVSAVGFTADETSTDNVDEGDLGAARMTLDRKVIVTPEPHTAGGLSIFRSIDLDEGTLEVVKASPGQIYGVWVTNTATSTRFIKFYNATSGTAGTGTPVITIGIPGNSSDDVSGNFGPGGMGITFDTGISVGAVTGVADNDTGAPGSNEVIINVFYK